MPDFSRAVLLRSHTLAALVLCLAAVMPAAGQTPAPPAPAVTIEGPATIAPYTLGRFAVKGDPSAKVAWMILPRASQVTVGQQLVLTGQPGNYTVIAFAVVAGQPVILQQAVSIAGPAPAPSPAPDPTPSPAPDPAPPPGPAPISGHLWVTAVYDFARLQDLPAGQRDMRTSATLGPALKKLDATWRNFDKGTAVGSAWVTRFSDVPLPFVVIQASDGAILGGKPRPLPEFEFNLIAIIDVLRSGK